MSKSESSAVFSTIACLLLMATGFLMASFSIPYSFVPYLLAILAGGWKQTWEGTQELVHDKRLNVDLLMALAAIGACIIGHWFEGAMLTFIFCLSGALEEYTTNKSTREISSLMALQPTTALKMIESGELVEVPVEALQLKDTIMVAKGSAIPIDGIVIQGNSSVDEAAISGESIPVEKRLGSEVFSGTINLGQPLYIEVTQTSENTRFAKIIQLVEEAQQMPSQTATLIEKIERIYVPIVLIAVPLMIVLCTFFTNWGFQESFYRGMVLLVVASPCALVASATPATLAAISHAARLGVLCKGGQALDAFANVKAIAFDKTGTLTRGKPAVTDVHLLLDEPFIPQLIVGMEKQSNHPLAEAILAYFHDEKPLELAVEEQAGVGLAATYQAAHWTIGKEVDLTSVAANEQTRIHELKAAGKTLIYINRDRVLAGYLALLDQPRPEARESLAYFNEQGIHTTMLTGDHLGTAKVIAAEIGLSDYESDCLPDEKTTRIKEMKETYKINAMVGDGINDAPALATASVGIAMGEGTDVAMDVADIVLMKNDLLRLVDSHRLAKKLQRIIKQNIVFSISVILLLIASNFLEFLTLPLGVVGHEGSTILVILNGLRMLLPLHKETPQQAKPTRKDCDDCVLYQQSLHT